MQDMFSSQLPEDADADADPVSDFPNFDVISPSDEQVDIVVFVGGCVVSDGDDCVGTVLIFDNAVTVWVVLSEH
jgi:hypothetical protein